MEKPFIFFHTGTALGVAVLVLPIAVFLGVIAMSLMPDIKPLQFLASFAGFASILWIPFWLDCRLTRKRR